MSEQEEEYDYHREPEPDPQTINMHKNRSRYFFAMMSFLIALLFLSIYLNNYYDFISGWLLILGIIAFGAVGVIFLSSNNIFNRAINTRADFKGSDIEKSVMVVDDDTDDLERDQSKYVHEIELSPFEQLVKEALATIPAEFHEKMENVLVRVQYEPGEEVMQRVGMKEGYTLLGLYEGVPLTTYGQARVPHPEIITIYQRTIEAYCHGDPDRIREQVRHTVLHEVAHHFGIDHEEMPIWIR
ncbi:MAG TPA: metallopeptidase family protein [Ktedonobacteraceae bacterium]